MRSCSVAAVLVLAIIASPGMARAETFRYKFRPGQVLEYRSSVAGAGMLGPTGSDMMKMQMRSATKQVQRVRSVSGDVATIEVNETPLSGKMTAFGQSQEYKPPASRSVLRVQTAGKVLSRQALSPAGGVLAADVTGVDGLDAMWGIQFPARDLKPGETWEETLSVSDDPESQKVLAKFRYVGREKVLGRNCAKFTTVFSMTLPMDSVGGEEAVASGGPEGESSISGTVTTYFDPEAGHEVYSSGSIVIRVKADLSGISPEGGEFANVTKINYVQKIVTRPAKKK